MSSNSNQCAICRESLFDSAGRPTHSTYNDEDDDADVRQLECNHMFHRSCLQGWVKAKKDAKEEVVCPTCRKPITVAPKQVGAKSDASSVSKLPSIMTQEAFFKEIAGRHTNFNTFKTYMTNVYGRRFNINDTVLKGLYNSAEMNRMDGGSRKRNRSIRRRKTLRLRRKN
jgi:hypothetical protein